MKTLYYLFLLIPLLIAGCDKDEESTQYKAFQNFPLITESRSFAFSRLYWRVPMIPRSVSGNGFLRKYKTIDSYGEDYVQTRCRLDGDTVYLYQKEMEDFGRRYQKETSQEVLPRPVLWGIKSMHIVAYDKENRTQQIDDRTILHVPPHNPNKEEITYAGKSGYHIHVGDEKKCTDDLPLSKVNTRPELFTELSPLVDFHIPKALWQNHTQFLLEVELENGSRFTTRIHQF